MILIDCILKPLLRKWLKKRVMNVGLHVNKTRKAYNWIYNSPLTTWRDKLYVLNHPPKMTTAALTSSICDLSDEKLLYEFLRSKD